MPGNGGSGDVADRLADLERLGEVRARRLQIAQAESAGAALVKSPRLGGHVAQPFGRREHAVEDLPPGPPPAGQRERPLDRPAQTADGLPATRRGRRLHRLPEGSGLFEDAARMALRPDGEAFPEGLLPEVHLPGLPDRLIEVDPQAVPRAVGLHHLARQEPVEDAIGVLEFNPRRASKLVAKTLKSAIANAESTHNVDVDTLYVKAAWVDGAQTQKRFLPRAHGRATRGIGDFIYLTVPTDIGGAIVAGGEIFHGPDGLAGELCHVPVELDGPRTREVSLLLLGA